MHRPGAHALAPPSPQPHLGKLIRFETSKSALGELVSFDDYISRAAVEQKDIYYLCAPNRALAEASPYFEAFQKRGLEVVFCYEPVDEFVMAGLMNFDGRRIVSAETADLELPELLKGGDGEQDAEAKGADAAAGPAKVALEGDELTQLVEWAKTTLQGHVSEVKVRAQGHPRAVRTLATPAAASPRRCW